MPYDLIVRNGMIVDGAIRDVAKIRKIGFNVFARATCVYDSQNRQRVVDLDVVVEIDGVRFAPGDLVFADEDGVVVVPQAVETQAIAAAWKKVHDENVTRDAIKGSPDYDPEKPFTAEYAAQLHDQIKEVTDVSEVKIIGGQRRQIRVTLDESRMAAFNVAPASIIPILEQANRQLQSGSFASGNREFLVQRDQIEVSRRDIADQSRDDGFPIFFRSQKRSARCFGGAPQP